MLACEEPVGEVCLASYLIVPREQDGKTRFFAYDNAEVEASGRTWLAIRFARDGWPAMLHALQIYPCREELERDPASWPGALPQGFMTAAQKAEFFCARADAKRRILAHELGPVGAVIGAPLRRGVPAAPSRATQEPKPIKAIPADAPQGELWS